MTLIIQVPGTFSGASLGNLLRDKVLDGAAGGVRFLYDFNRPYSWPSQADPADAEAVIDLSGHANGSFDIPVGQSLTFSGGGISFAAITADPVTLDIPASVAADLWADQNFLAVQYVKLPIEADFLTVASAVKTYMTACAGTNFAAEVDIFSTGPFLSGGIKYIAHRRQTTSFATFAAANVALDAADFGKVAQIAVWRNAAGEGLRVKTAAGTRLSTFALGVKNTTDFSAKVGKWGVSNVWNTGDSAQIANAKSMVLHRGFIENLQVSGRDPIVVIDADWARHAARFP